MNQENIIGGTELGRSARAGLDFYKDRNEKLEQSGFRKKHGHLANMAMLG